MAQFLPAAIMFLVTVLVSAALIVPVRAWAPKQDTVRLYWTGTWLFLVAIAAVAGAMNTLTLLGLDVVGPVTVALNALLVGLVGFVVLGWFHLVGLGIVTGVVAAVRRTTRRAPGTAA